MAGYYRRPSKASRNFATDARKIKDSAFKHTYRGAEQYRDERLDDERERLERRLSWAIGRGDEAGVKHVQRRLDQLADEALTDIDAGCTPGRLERWKLDFTN
ncbi:hypothetical protein [Vreelandella aquamarina]|uniref:Uncharacterized protein n=1 Tax=Vreelandella aquamarina TaxID=77097 RepID=A0A857GMR1_9GAMM|nr:hypothetical protein [Halomonas meridiana]QHD49796.1 hypothetical protein CTT34_08890 [Halomonas meridiana]